MEANSHFESTGKPTIPNTSGLKPLPQSVEPVYITSSLVRFPQQAKGLNSDMPVNGRISPPMSTNANGTLDPSTTCHPVSNNYDYLWKFTKPPVLKDCHGLSQYQVNGSTSPVTNGPSCKASLQETWDNCATSPAASLSFSGQGLCNFGEASLKLAAAANGTNLDYLESSRPVSMLASGVQPLLTSSNERKQTEKMGSNIREEAKNDSGLVEASKPCNDQADLRSDCNGPDVALTPLCQMASSILPPPGVSNLDDPSQLPSDLEGPHLLNSDSLKPFGIDLDQDSASDMAEEAQGNKDGEPNYPIVNISQDKMVIEKISPEPIFAQEPEDDELEPGEIKGNVSRRRMATAEEVRLPLLHGWKREVRIKKGSHRWQGETWYYAPCGKRMKQFPEVIKYLSKKTDPIVRREHFSFSPRMPVGDFYELRDTAEGPQWELLNSEEIPSRILAITGKRGRPRNMEKAKLKENKVKRGRGRPPKVKMIDLLSKPDAKLLRKLENQDILSDVEKVQLSKLRKKMRRKARNQEAKLEAANNLKLKEKKDKEEKQQKAKEIAQEQETNKVKRRPREKAKPTVHKPDRNQLAQQRRLEERKRQQFMLEELKKPTEDMCLSDHQPLPDFPHVPGVVLPSSAFADCFTTVEFLQTYGKVLGFDGTKDIPSLFTLQEGLFNVEDSLGEVQDLLVKLLRAAMVDPGLPPYWQSLKILGERVSEICLNRDNVSEALRIFLEAYSGDGELCESLRTHPFQAHPPLTKAAVLAFLVNELNSSNLIINEIDKTLENMSHYRKNKWIIEGKIRRLKFALSKRTGNQETQVINVPEGRRRRSVRITDENEEQEGDESALQQLCVGEEDEAASSLSVVELERQIEKLTKRQIFFRKKILSSSQRLRCGSLGQDRYRRFYWVLPHLGGIFVEGSLESAGHTPETETTQLPLKTEEDETMEDKFSSAGRTRGRPRKSKAGTEIKCISCNCADSLPSNDLVEPRPLIAPVSGSQQDLNQSAFMSWLNQNQTPLINSAVPTPEGSPLRTEATLAIPSLSHAEDTGATEKQDLLTNIIPRTPCTDSSHGLLSQPDNLVSAPYPNGATTQMQINSCSPFEDNGFPKEGQPLLAGTPLPSASTPCLICGNHQKKDNPQSLNFVHVSEKEKRRGRPPSNFFKEIEQKYNSQLIERPVPADMKQKWWWIKDPVMVESMLKALHPRGIREKTLHKHLTKHLEHLKELCSRPASDSIFSFDPTEGNPVSQEALDKWSVVDWTFQVDLSILQWVEHLEERVLMSDLQQRGWTPPSLDSVRSDLKYFEHHLEPTDDITVKVKKDEPLYREPSNPLDLAVLRLLDLEQNVERRYLKEPLWVLSDVQHEKAVFTDPENPLSTTEIEYSITPRLRLWRQTLERCRSAAQVSLCLQQLERSVAWERSVNKVICIVCRKGDNDEFLLLCDSCDRGCHTYCHRPRMAEIPEGDWFCPSCVSLQGGNECIKSYGSSRRAKKPRLCFQENNSPSKSSRRRDQATISQYSPVDAPLSKRGRMITRSHGPDLTFCEIILMEMESHDDAWPFLEPVNPRLVPGYRKIIKNPMDFSTMRHKLLNGKYSSCDEFAEDAELVFSNCQLFNEDDSEVGKAGLALRKFYESRWEEFSQERNQGLL